MFVSDFGVFVPFIHPQPPFVLPSVPQRKSFGVRCHALINNAEAQEAVGLFIVGGNNYRLLCWNKQSQPDTLSTTESTFSKREQAFAELLGTTSWTILL